MPLVSGRPPVLVCRPSFPEYKPLSCLLLQTDSWVQTKGLDPYYSLFDSRINALIAGVCTTPGVVPPE